MFILRKVWLQECHVKKGSMLLVFSRETEPIGAIYMYEGGRREEGRGNCFKELELVHTVFEADKSEFCRPC